MKLNLNKKGQAGMTLIEITLVIAVLLGLISVLFIGVAAYKKGSDRAKCILNIATVQKAIRSYQNLYELENGDTVAATSTIIGTDRMIEVAPDCPAEPNGTHYTFKTVVPDPGVAFLTCDFATDHAPTSTDGW
ncbi:MAG: type II secretion system protein [Verrucomicrobiae bacterium]|nr:type II secretion system protein [Verrucomicrobiae bacterium]